MLLSILASSLLGMIGCNATDRARKEPPPYETTAAEIADILVAHYRSDKTGTDLASVFNSLGSLAGFGCQMAIREGFVKPGLISEQKAFVVVKARDGGFYYFGDFLNAPLLGDGGNRISVWSLVAGGAHSAGAKELPDLNEIVRQTHRLLERKTSVFREYPSNTDVPSCPSIF